MAVEYVKGNIIELFNNGEHEILIHGCNCFHTMGRGLALALRQRWEEVYEADLTSECGDYDKLGKFTVAKIDKDREVYNLYSQYRYGKKEVYIKYTAIEEGLSLIAAELKRNDDEHKRIIMPLIGATNGGADPIFIKQVIQGILGDLNVTVVMDEIKESRDKVHLIQFPVTRDDDWKKGLELFTGLEAYREWCRVVGTKAAILTTAHDISTSGFLSKLPYLGARIFAVSDPAASPVDFYTVTYVSSAEHGLMLARDHCVMNDHTTIYIIGERELLRSTLDYCDIVHHLELKRIDRESPTLPDWSLDEVEQEDSWINERYSKISSCYGHVDISNTSVVHTNDIVYKRNDKKYREYHGL